MIKRRAILGRIGDATLGALLIGARPFLARATAPPGDENLPDTSSYETFRHPVAEDLDYVHDLYAKADRMTETRQALPHHLNLRYGMHVKQRLDLYLPIGGARSAPVLLFIHGGGFEEGHRAHYGYIALPYAARGVITAVMGYRLVTDGFHYPAQVDDVKNALAWLRQSVARYGGNPDALFVCGHSAGTTLTAEVGVDRTWMSAAGLPPSALKGIVPVSGKYDLTATSPEDPTGQDLASFCAPTAVLRERASALRHIDDPARSAIVAQGAARQYERLLTRSSPEFVQALQKSGVDAKLIVLHAATHIDTVFALATPGSPLFDAVATMIEKHAV